MSFQSPMRLLVLALALIAGAKIWFQDSLFRAGAEEALVAAYQARAVEACRKAAATGEAGLAGSQARDWGRAEITMSAGNRNLPVHLWQTDHPSWNARFRDPQLVLKPGGSDTRAPVCTFDVLTGEAVAGQP